MLKLREHTRCSWCLVDVRPGETLLEGDRGMLYCSTTCLTESDRGFDMFKVLRKTQLTPEQLKTVEEFA